MSDINTTNDDTNAKSNLKELINSKDLVNLDSTPTIEFTMDKLNNQTSKDYNFDFNISGKIDDNDLNGKEIKEKFKMNEIKEPSNCKLIIKMDRKAYLNCQLNIEKYKDIKLITFNTNKIEKNEYKISFVNLNKDFLINEA